MSSKLNISKVSYFFNLIFSISSRYIPSSIILGIQVIISPDFRINLGISGVLLFSHKPIKVQITTFIIKGTSIAVADELYFYHDFSTFLNTSQTLVKSGFFDTHINVNFGQNFSKHPYPFSKSLQNLVLFWC